MQGSSHERSLSIGILAHVDAGKTTLTEQFLYQSGQIRSMGTVDEGNTITDNLPLEQKRGISIQTGVSAFTWKNHRINIIDTPGHVDFSAEVERSLVVLDVALVLVSAVEGLQAHTYSILEVLKERKIPTLILINKLDRAGADFELVLEELHKDLKLKPFVFYMPNLPEGPPESLVSLFESENLSAEQKRWKEFSLEQLAECDDEVMEAYLEGKELPLKMLYSKTREKTTACNILPVVPIVAKEGLGITETLDILIDQFPVPSDHDDQEFSAFVFKLSHDKKLGRIAFLKVLKGKLSRKQEIFDANNTSLGKVAGIKVLAGAAKNEINELYAGEIGIINGLPTIKAGDYLGKGEKFNYKSFKVPVLTVQVIPQKAEEYSKLGEALSLLNAEDQHLQFTWYKAEREMHLKLMGPMQIEVLSALILDRFGIDTTFENPTVIYKETISKTVTAGTRYTMPKPCWAVVDFMIEPGELGSGISYTSKVSTDKIAAKYQNEIEQTIPKVLEQGVFGWEQTDIKITLVGGEDHEVHSRPGDFIIATPMALLKAVSLAEPLYLEPYYSFEIKAFDELLGSISGELSQLRAIFDPPLFHDGKFTIKGQVPIAGALDLPIKINALTGGRGKVKLDFGDYKPCEENLGVKRERVGVNPLDESRWILHKRGAFKVDQTNY